MYKRIQQELVCPICKSKFIWHIKNEDEDQIYDAEAICDDCGCSYPICSGIASFLKPKYNDLRIWKKCDRSDCIESYDVGSKAFKLVHLKLIQYFAILFSRVFHNLNC